MEIFVEIKQPSYSKTPDFITAESKVQMFPFACTTCGSMLNIDLKDQINSSWAGKSGKISDLKVAELKQHYGIGIVDKAHIGGMPVFDQLVCAKCRAHYLTYCDVQEFRNSAFTVQVQGIIRIEGEH